MPTAGTLRRTKLGNVATLDRVAVSAEHIVTQSVYVGLEHLSSDGRITPCTVNPGELKSTKLAFTDRHVLYGKLRPYLRKIARPSTAGICSMDIVPVLPGPDLDRDYLFHWLRQPRVVSLATARSEGVNLPRVSATTLLELPFSLPPLDEQRRIAAMLDVADAIRRKRRESLRLLDELLRSAFLEMFGDPVKNEKGWPRVTLGELLPERQAIVDGPFGSSLKPDSYVKAGVRVVRNFNIKDDAFDDSAFKYITVDKFEEVRRSEVKSGDVLISTKGTLGNVCLLPDLRGHSVLSATGTVRVRLPDALPLRRQFMVSQMVTPSYKQYLKGFQAGTNQKYLNLSGIRKLAVILPPIEIQDRFCGLRNRVTDLRVRYTAALDVSDGLCESLAQALFGGDHSKVAQATAESAETRA